MHNDVPSTSKNDARTFCAKLSAYLDGGVPPEVLCEVVEHVRTCQQPCRGVHDDVVTVAECCRKENQGLAKVPTKMHESLMTLIMAEVRGGDSSE